MKDAVETADYIDADEMADMPENKLQKRSGGALVQAEMSPESLTLEIQRQTQMRAIMTDYVRSQMQADHHYYRFNDAGKPALTKDGGYLICGLFKATPGETTMEIIREEGGHFTVVSRASLFNQNGNQIAFGNGSCTTREAKYAYRWAKESELPIGFNKADAVTREGWAFKNQLPDGYDFRNAKTREVKGGKYTMYATTEYRVPNKDLADLENTVIKMSNKRAFIAAVQQLPLVSELFATDPDGGNGDKPEGKAPAARSASAPRRSASASSEPPPADYSSGPAASNLSSVDSAVSLAKKLIEHGVEEEDLAMQFLPEGVAKFSDLTEDQAAEQIPAMSQLLNNKLAEKKNGKTAVV